MFFAVLSLASAASVHGSGATAADRLFEAGYLQAANDLPAGEFTSSLEALSPEARARALSQLQSLAPPAEDAAYLRADPGGSLLYVEFPAPETGEAVHLASDTKDSVSYAEAAVADGELIAETEAVAGDPSKVFRLHSRPGSSKVLFLDFDGHRLQNTIWNTIMGQSVLEALPFDTDFNDNPKSVANFTQGELNRIAHIWHRVAADFAPFDIDVTTEEPAVFTATTGHVIITDDRDAAGRYMPYFNSTGAAHVDVFGNSDYADYPALVYWTNLYTYLQGYPAPVAESVSHEFGHHLGLSHDGLDSAPDYYWYQGHGLGLVSWAPIMGSSQGKEVTQWDRGEYPGATNFEDDLAIIGQKLGYIGDDHANSSSQATALVVDPDGTILASSPEFDPDNVLTENKGIIGNRNDVDWFYVDVAGSGTLEITATPSWHSFTLPGQRGENLDIKLSLYNSSLTLITTDDPDDNTDAAVTAAVTSGRYYLQVDGVGNSTNSDYSDYGSIGMYFIEGWVPRDGSPADTTPPSPSQMSWAAAPSATGTSSISMTAVTASDASGSVEYYFTCVSGGSGCSSSGWQTSRSYTDTGLQAGTSYSYNVRARDAAGNMNNPSATASATTEAEPDTTPPSPTQMSWQSPPTATGTSSISMTAVTATDDSGTVEYYFTCVSGGTGCSSSGWQSSPIFADSGLQANTSYSYNVRARDAAGNVNNPSATASATTEAEPDTTPPSPTQMSWQSPPTATGTSSISMTAVTAADESGAVEYYFTCVSGGTGCSSSGWQTSPSFVDSGLQANTSYSYNVRARDPSGNVNNPSAAGSATTDAEPDTTPPSPSQMSWAAAPSATGTSSISMTAVTATDESGTVEYYFTCVSGGTGCNSSGWQTSRSYTDTGLQAGTSYSYNVRARDAAGNMNNPSATASATTDAEAGDDTTPPSPARMSWQSPPTATGSSTISMTAVTATDDSGYVEYYFACVSGNGCNSSGWQTSRTYIDSGLQADTAYSYKVMAQDAAGNRNNLSSTASATTDAVGTPSDTTPPSPAQMSWQSPPAATGTSSISMTAVTATDASGSVEYYFTCVSGGSGCSSSGWQTSRTFTDSGLQANTSYSYNVRARDAAGNMNNPSATASATTDGSQPPPINQPPVAVASYSPNPAVIERGKSLVVTLQGNQSYDPDGSISAWTWRDQTGAIVSTSATHDPKLQEGEHVFSLAVTDNSGASNTTQITVTVEPRQNGRKLPGDS